MKKLFQLILLIISFSCSKEKPVIQGSLENFAKETFVIHRDEQTGYIGIQGVINQEGKPLISAYWNYKFSFFDPKTGQKSHEIEIPKEGPLSIRGGLPQEAQGFDDFFILLGRLNDLQFRKGNEILNSTLLNFDTLGINLQNSMSSHKQKITEISHGIFEISNNPFDLMALSNRTIGFDVENFGAWISQFDQDGNWICISDFRAPFDESYSETVDAGDLMRITSDGVSWTLFPFSDSLYRTENCQVTQTITLESISPIRYFPSKEVSNGASRTWVRPDDAAINLYLFDDPTTGLKIRFTLLEKKSGESDFADPRMSMFSDEKHYLVMIYDLEWKLAAELKMNFGEGTRFENIFLMDGYLLINKPEQKSEDEYEFYKIDLSQFRN